jgi:hypothetical protein
VAATPEERGHGRINRRITSTTRTDFRVGVACGRQTHWPTMREPAPRLRKLARSLCLPRGLRTVTAAWNHGSFGKWGQIIRTVRAVTLPHQNVPWSSGAMPATACHHQPPNCGGRVAVRGRPGRMGPDRPPVAPGAGHGHVRVSVRQPRAPPRAEGCQLRRLLGVHGGQHRCPGRRRPLPPRPAPGRPPARLPAATPPADRLAPCVRPGRRRRIGQPAGAVLLRFVFAEAEEVGEGRQLRRPGR